MKIELRRVFTWLLVLVGLLSAGCGSLGRAPVSDWETSDSRWPEKDDITLVISGPNGAGFEGTLYIDGKPSEIAGTVPFEKDLFVDVLKGEVRQIKGGESIAFSIRKPNGTTLSFGSTDSSIRYFQFLYQDGGVKSRW